MEYIDEFVRHEYCTSPKKAERRMWELRAVGRRAYTTVHRKGVVEVRILPTYKSASVMAKAAGLSSLAEMSRICCQPENTLHNWWKYKPMAFTAMLEGCVAIKRKAKEAEIE